VTTIQTAARAAVHSFPALEVAGVSKRFGDREALCDVSLAARPGVLHGLLGPNGAGKTTLMRILLGLVMPDGGIVRLFGRTIDSAQRAPLPDGVAGFVETAAFYPYLSGRRNLELLSRLDGGPAADRRERVTRALADVSLADHADVSVGAYSAGMRQRLGVAAALLRAPKLLVLDEPTSSLDPAGARDVRAHVRRLANDGAAVVWSSHDMAEVEELCAAISVINKGRVIFSGTVDELRRVAPAAVRVLHTSDDRAAFMLATRREGLKAKVLSDPDGGLELSGDVGVLDAYVIALGRAGVAVRRLERRTRSLESLFLELTSCADTVEAPATTVNAADATTPEAALFP
jgi:ABC-2 type transport system ATP-binding protein